MNIYKIVKKRILSLLDIAVEFSIETSKTELHGDIALNLPLILSQSSSKKPMEIAEDLLFEIRKLDFVEKAEAAAPGFINIWLASSFVYAAFRESVNPDYGLENTGHGTPINIEYCSANPTGPIHIGHTRGTVYGDILSNLLLKNGYKVTKEFYVNDAGGQINTLLKSLYIRIRQLKGENIEIPPECYPGDYLIEIAKDVIKNFGEDAFKKNYDVQKFVIQAIMKKNIQDLLELKVYYDTFTSEKSLIEAKEIEKVIDILEKKKLLYKGILPKPKGKSSEEWEEREQLLFKSTEFGDTEDRALKKSDGTHTYFASDIAYHKNKIDRGFNKMVLVLGADHAGYISRITAAAKAIALNPEKIEIVVKVCQTVKFLENGVSVSMSKRKGTFTTLSEVLEEVDPDILRFIMLIKKNDSPIDFDLVKVKEETKENPIFYIQYTFSRCSSLIRNFKGDIEQKNVNLLENKQELAVIKKVLLYPKIMDMAVKKMEPHLIANYLLELASSFHILWNMGNENHSLRFLTDNENLSAARMFLVKAVMNVILSAFSIFEIKPIERM